jgi:hypothetical protein
MTKSAPKLTPKGSVYVVGRRGLLCVRLGFLALGTECPNPGTEIRVLRLESRMSNIGRAD